MKKKKIFNVIGIMTGTSMDGIDISFCRTNGTNKCIVIKEKSYSYSREIAAFPTRHQKEHKYWPTVGRIDNAYGDRNLICTCPSVDEYK